MEPNVADHREEASVEHRPPPPSPALVQNRLGPAESIRSLGEVHRAAQQREAGPLSKVRRLLPSWQRRLSPLGFLKLRSSCGQGVEMAGTLLLARLLQLNAGFPVRTDASLALQPIKSREESVSKGEETGAACASDVTDPPPKLARTQSGGRRQRPAPFPRTMPFCALSAPRR